MLFCHDFGTGSSRFSTQNSTTAAYVDLLRSCTSNTSAILTTSPSKSTFGYCVPSSGGDNNTSIIDQAFAKLQASNNFNDSVASVTASASIMVLGAVLAIIVGFAFLQLVSCFASIVVYTSLVLINLGLLLCALMLFQSAAAYKENFPNTYQDMDDYSTAYYGAMAMVVLTVISLLVTLVLIPRVRLAIKIMKVTGNALRDAPMVMLVPAVTAAMLLLTYGLWSVVSVYLFSVGDIKAVSNPSLPGGVAREVEFSESQRNVFLYHLFGLFWIGAFLRAVAQMIIGFVGVSWYFAPQEGGSRKPQSRLTARMAGTVMWYHLGSAALGSFLIAVVQFIRTMFEYYVRQSKKYQNNPVIKLTICCVRCCLWCVECCLRFINKMAYIFIGLTGKPFVTAACTGISYVGTNALRVGTLLVLKAVFLTVGKLLTAAVPAGIVYLILSNGTYADPGSASAVANPFLPATIVLLFGYMVGGTFASVYDTMSDAIIMSFCYNEVHKVFTEGEDDPSAHIKSIAAQVEEEDAAAAASKVKPQGAVLAGKPPAP